jgi:CSLREA domain-containing protein
MQKTTSRTVRRKSASSVSGRKWMHPAVHAAIEVLETRRLLTTLAYTGTIQTYTVPATGIYELSIGGAQGGDTSNGPQQAETGGAGAALSGDVSLTAGSVLQVVVGGEGTSNAFGVGGGGGGGSFVFVSGASQPIVVAGGGGGGAGWLGDGGNGNGAVAGGGGLGSSTFAGGSSGEATPGRFGGGGGGGYDGGGAGGGYSGGGGADIYGDGGFGGGGGGSYTADLTGLTSAVTETGNGYFDITPLPTPTITSAAQPASAYVGTTIADKATVTGGDSPTGTVTFNLYDNDTATGPALFTDTENLSGGTATSAGFPTTAAGTDYWVATYNGDSNNSSVSTVDNADPATVTGSLVVTSTSDSTTATGNTLRDAIAYANTLGAGTHAITFDPTVFATAQTITLSSTLGALTPSDTAGTITITGPSAGVTISGNNAVIVFVIDSGTVTLNNLTISHGYSDSTGSPNPSAGGIYNDGTASITAAADAIAGGPYTVAASASGVATAADFSLTNNAVGSLVVNTTGDPSTPVNGENSLREAIAYANSLGGNQTITFASNVTGTITLAGTELELSDSTGNITIDGPGASLLSVSGAGTSRVFLVDPGTTAEIDGLTITDGNSSGQAGINGYGNSLGGGIDSLGTLTVSNCVVSNNQGPYSGEGIASTDYANLTVIDSTLSGNSVGGDGAAEGGGIDSQGTLSLQGSSVTGNSATSDGGGIFGYRKHAIGELERIRRRHCVIQRHNRPTDQQHVESQHRLPIRRRLRRARKLVSSSHRDQQHHRGKHRSERRGNRWFGDVKQQYCGRFSLQPQPQLLHVCLQRLEQSACRGRNPGFDERHKRQHCRCNRLGNGPRSAGQLWRFNADHPAAPRRPDDWNRHTDYRHHDRPNRLYTFHYHPQHRGVRKRRLHHQHRRRYPQSTTDGSPFAMALGVQVTSNNALLTNLAGGSVTFSAPGTGPSATFGTNPITLAANGTGSTTATANSTGGGPYNVSATASGIATPATFPLTNIAPNDSISGTDYLVF